MEAIGQHVAHAQKSSLSRVFTYLPLSGRRRQSPSLEPRSRPRASASGNIRRTGSSRCRAVVQQARRPDLVGHENPLRAALRGPVPRERPSRDPLRSGSPSPARRRYARTGAPCSDFPALARVRGRLVRQRRRRSGGECGAWLRRGLLVLERDAEPVGEPLDQSQRMPRSPTPGRSGTTSPPFPRQQW